MIRAKKEWMLLEQEHSLVSKFEKELDVSYRIAQILVNRGFSNVEAARRFLEVDKQGWHDPFLFFDMDKTVLRIQEAVENQEKIIVFGDYDADGVTSTAIIMMALTRLGSQNHEFYIPNRFTEGYGPNRQALEKFHSDGVQLIISVDTGISALDEVKFANQVGMDFIVTDHHHFAAELPDAYSIIHPHRTDLEEEYKDLSGAGVALKVSHALLGTISDDLLALAAIGTISDLVPLLGENRAIAFQGLRALRQTTLPGLLALTQNVGIPLESISEESVGYTFAPRINAAGRMESADIAVDLLLSTNLKQAREIAEQLELLNKERQDVVQIQCQEAIEMVQKEYPADAYPVIVLAKENWNTGVIGIVASKLVDKFGRPAIVLAIDSETGLAKGSGRSIEGFDLYEKIAHFSEKLIHFGGHPMAAGLTLHQKDIAELRTLLCQSALESHIQAKVQVDMTIDIKEISLEWIRQLDKLAPFGSHNPKPLFHIENVFLKSARKIGSEQNHLKALLSDKRNEIDSVGFGFGSKVDEVSPFDRVSLIGQLSINEWKNHSKPQFVLQDIACSTLQIFDLRSTPITQAVIQGMTEPKICICFTEEGYEQMSNRIQGEVTLLNDTSFEGIEWRLYENIVLLDLPTSPQALERLFRMREFSKIYLFLKANPEKMFQTMPTREKFMNVYGILLKNSPFDYDKNKKKLASSLGLSNDLLDFIIKVFFELSFVTIDNGFVTVAKNVSKRSLEESNLYLQMQTQIELENKLLLSSSDELITFFHQLNR